MPADKKRRVRAHVIADLSVNHVEYYALKAGFTVEVFRRDYGIDLDVFTYDSKGRFEEGNVYLQLKATDQPRFVSAGRAASLDLSAKDLRSWVRQPMPFIVVLFDARRERAYWVYIQRYLAKQGIREPSEVKSGMAVRVPVRNRLNAAAFRKFATFRDCVMSQIEGVISHG